LKRFVIFLVFISICLFILCNIASAQSIGKVYPKDPDLALVLSIIDPGFGVFYVGEPSFGVLFWSIDKALIFATLFTFFEIRISFPPDIGITIEFGLRDMSGGMIVIPILLGALIIGFRVFAVISARNWALEFNKKLFESNTGTSNNENVILCCDFDNGFNIGLKLVF